MDPRRLLLGFLLAAAAMALAFLLLIGYRVLLVGVWRPVRGHVRLDGASLDQWATDALGRHLGYLPQDVELLAGTVAQNIARFEPNADTAAVIAAAKAVGVHDLIVRLPAGYDTPVGEQGSALSAGQGR